MRILTVPLVNIRPESSWKPFFSCLSTNGKSASAHAGPLPLLFSLVLCVFLETKAIRVLETVHSLSKLRVGGLSVLWAEETKQIHLFGRLFHNHPLISGCILFFLFFSLFFSNTVD